MVLVTDASVATARRLRDRPGTLYADSVIEQGGLENVVVPDLFWHEVRSVLLCHGFATASRRKGPGGAMLALPGRPEASAPAR